MVSIVSTVRDIERLRQILLVLGRHGFGEVVQRTGLGRLIPRREGSKAEAPADEERILRGSIAPPPLPPTGLGVRLRLVLQDLGPSFVKLGQILSTRPDLIPEDIIAELKKLQDQVPPVEQAQIHEVLETELGGPMSEIFAEFDEKPLACASIAQVHRAKLALAGPDRAPEVVDVVVKVQRPGIKTTIERDIELLYLFARALERSIPESRIYAPVGLVTEFDRAISAELDFLREAEHAERFAKSFEGSPEVAFPKVYRQLTTRRVLTLEFVNGKKIGEALAAGYSGERLAKSMLQILFKQIYEDGFFHGDPHPGNILIRGTPDAPQVVFIDLGLVGRLSPALRDKTVDLLLAAVRKDPQAVADALYAIGTPTKRIDRAKYDAEVTFLAEKYLGKPLKDIEISLLIRDIVSGAIKYGLEIPPEFLMLGRTLMTVEGVGKEVYPDLDVFSEAKPFFTRLVMQRYSPERLAEDALRTLQRVGVAAQGLPDRVATLLDELERGNLTLTTYDPQLSRAGDLLGRRIFSGLTVASLVASGAFLLGRGDRFGYTLFAVAGLWLLGHAARAALLARKLSQR